MVESDKQSRTEIEETFSHQSHWDFSFFTDLKSMLNTNLENKPMAILVDIQHFGQNESSEFEIQNINSIKNKFPESELLVFSDPEHESWAVRCLHLGALDYILVNPHQFIKLEYELKWLEDVLDERNANKDFIRKLFLLLGFMALFIGLIVLLYEMGFLKEGNDPNVLIGI